MSDDGDKILTFKERQELFNARLSTQATAKLPKSPRLPPRTSISHNSSESNAAAAVTAPPPPARTAAVAAVTAPPTRPARDVPPPMPPRRPSTCTETETCEDIPYQHVSERRQTRKAVRIRRSPTVRRSPSPNAEKTDTIKRSPSTKDETIRRSPSTKDETIRRRSSSKNDTRRSSSKDETRRSPSPRARPALPTTPPPPRHSIASHRPSLPAENLPPPDLPPRRNSYDDRINLNAAVGANQSNYHYASKHDPLRSVKEHGSRPAPAPPSDISPYAVTQSPRDMILPNPHSSHRRSSQYLPSQPPPIKLSSHPHFQRAVPSRPAPSPAHSPSFSRLSGTPPPVPSTLPPPLTKSDSAAPKPSIAEDSLLGSLEDDISEYEDDDDIYGQIHAIDLDGDDDEDLNADFVVVQKPAPVQQQLSKASGFREYWHERVEVVESGILEGDQITKNERARQEAMYEIFTSEQTYRKSMETLEKQFLNDNLFLCYLEPDDDEDMPGPEDILGNIDEIMSISKRLVDELRGLYESKVTIDSVAGVLRPYVDHLFSAYITYCSNTSLQQEIITEKRKQDPEFDKFLDGIEKALVGQNLQSFLIMPMQRICRMPLLLDAVLKKTDEDHPDRQAMETLHKQVCTIVQTCNDEARKSEVRREMASLEKRCDFSKISDSMTSFTGNKTRYIVKEGVVMKLNLKGGFKAIKINIWLFTDCLVIGATLDPKDESKITLTEYCPRQGITVVSHFQPPRNAPKKKLQTENIFHLTLKKAGQLANSKHGRHIIQCPSPQEKQKWLEVLRPPAVESENPDETIYEEWDVPLVKAEHHYSKANEDDLELYKGEVCRVLKKYTDGWCYGVRERDGQKGWFPMSFMVEIQSEHARYRDAKRKQELVDALAQTAQAQGVFNTMIDR